MSKLCIVGGGTALVGGLYFEKHTDWEIVQYESPNVPILGVGESTIPQIKWFFENLVSESLTGSMNVSSSTSSETTNTTGTNKVTSFR